MAAHACKAHPQKCANILVKHGGGAALRRGTLEPAEIRPRKSGNAGTGGDSLPPFGKALELAEISSRRLGTC